MNQNDSSGESPPPTVLAGLVGLVSLPAVHLALAPFATFLDIRWVGWLHLLLLAAVPMTVAFIILYRSSWHREFSKARRIVCLSASACLIYGIDLLTLALLVIVACLVVGLTRSIGGN
jgi:hypothetical protein